MALLGLGTSARSWKAPSSTDRYSWYDRPAAVPTSTDQSEAPGLLLTGGWGGDVDEGDCRDVIRSGEGDVMWCDGP
jgi:hypothetical protein